MKILIFVTNKCNFSCNRCTQKELLNLPYFAMSIKDIFKLHSYLKTKFKKFEIQFTGGEPTLWTPLYAACLYLIEKGYEVRVDTNCTNIDLCRELLNIGVVLYVDQYNVSSSVLKILENVPGRKKNIVVTRGKGHRILPTSPLKNSLPAICQCDKYCIENNKVYSCPNLHPLILRFNKDINDYKQYIRSFRQDSDWLEYFKSLGEKRFNIDLCQYCLSNKHVWEKAKI